MPRFSTVRASAGAARVKAEDGVAIPTSAADPATAANKQVETFAKDMSELLS
jgi:hypothetical protein